MNAFLRLGIMLESHAVPGTSLDKLPAFVSMQPFLQPFVQGLRIRTARMWQMAMLPVAAPCHLSVLDQKHNMDPACIGCGRCCSLP